jgi:AAA domain
MSTSFPRGSEWRKWDYHVHTPASWHYGDRGPDIYQRIATAIDTSECAAFGINDYLTIDGYLTLCKMVKKVVFPVVEFRMTEILVDKNVTGPHFNFHLLFTNDTKYLGQIQAFLSALHFQDYHGTTKNLTPPEIVDFGRQVLPDETDMGKLRIAALEKIVMPFSGVLDVLKKKGLRDQCLIIIPYDEYGGIDGIDPKADGLLKSGLIRDADMIGSSSPKMRQYLLGQSDKYTADQFRLWFGKAKPIIKGSDAHKPEHIGHLPAKADGLELHCWVKADLTFDGLKQTTYEPEARIFIGSTPPDQKDKSKVIDSLAIRSASGWFEDETVKLNRDLVCIIGGKGSGKTALVDLIGLAGGDFDKNNAAAFLNKANRELLGAKLLLKWEDGTTETELQVQRPLSVPSDRKVRYLSQSFVESLCSFDRHEQLEREIEDILFQYIPATDKLGAESFQSLKDKRTEGIRLHIDSVASKIRMLNEDIFNLGALIESRPQLVRERDQLEKDIMELHKQKPQPATEEERKTADELRRLNEARAKIADVVNKLRIKQSRLDVLKRKFGILAASIQAFNLDLASALTELGETDLISKLQAVMPSDGSVILSERIGAVAAQAAAVAGTGEALQDGKETLASLDQKINVLNQQSSIEEQKRKKLDDFNRRIAEHVQKRDALSQKVAAIEQTARKELDAKIGQRKQLFLGFFNALEEKRQALERLYEPLNATAAATEEGAKVQFYARYTFNVKKFATDAGDVFDQRRSVIRGEQAFVDAGQNFWESIEATLPTAEVKAVEDLLDVLTKRGQETRHVRDQLRSQKTTKDFNNWLYSLDYYDIEYGIKYEGTVLDKLSPGKKGVVLLLIYLTIDKDYRPLIIDQPEENLDNRSVYSTLVEYFRGAKIHRQVIIVTHNANLVVNGDAEQVIVANFEHAPTTQRARIRYTSGSMEYAKPFGSGEQNILDRQGIREHVCELLEGGETAFERREEKYGFLSK